MNKIGIDQEDVQKIIKQSLPTFPHRDIQGGSREIVVSQAWCENQWVIISLSLSFLILYKG